MNYILSLLLIVFCYAAKAQSFVFAELNGAPVNTTGWTLTGAATVGNVTGSGNSEVILCHNTNYMSGAIFYDQPIDLNLCNKWIAEFDFRIYDGSGADGIAFCFLDAPPTGFVNGGGLGIPGSANGLKVCFDTYLNCAATGSFTPKLELRWGSGYDECWAQPTLSNVSGALNVLRSPNYCHAKIVYNNGTIDVYINNILFLTGYQQFNFAGYLGFTASTGGSTDNHSIKNVVIYADLPPSEAGADQSICSGQTVQLGTASVPGYVYSWTPGADLDDVTISNPTFSANNSTTNPAVRKFYVSTALASSPGCASQDSVTITVLPAPSLSIVASSTTICSGDVVNFTATASNVVGTASYQWLVNGSPEGTDSPTFNSGSLNDGDVVSCVVTGGGPCASATSNDIAITVTQPVTPSISISGNTSMCEGSSITFSATTTNGGTSPVYQWMLNNNPVGNNNNSYTATGLQSGDVIHCELTSNAGCVTNNNALSNTISITVYPNPVVNLDKTPTLCEGTSKQLQAGNFASYLWNNGSTAPSLTVSQTGTYYVTVTDASGCEGSDTTKITSLIPTPKNFLPKDSIFCEFNSFVLQPSGNYTSWLWNDNSTNSQLQVTQPGLYWLEVITPDNCRGRDSVLYTVKNCFPQIHFPNAFSPDGNGRNDLFKPIVTGDPDRYEFAVYNRWGQRIFYTNDPRRGWDGTISGIAQPSSVFVWSCTYQFSGEVSKTEKGTVLLIR
mgnify:CR=1 FL=1